MDWRAPSVSGDEKKAKLFRGEPNAGRSQPLGSEIRMRVDDSSKGSEAGQFHTTHWTLVLALLREEVARSVSDPTEVEGELRALCDALVAAEGHLGP
jgi:hypothetical protein